MFKKDLGLATFKTNKTKLGWGLSNRERWWQRRWAYVGPSTLNMPLSKIELGKKATLKKGVSTSRTSLQLVSSGKTIPERYQTSGPAALVLEFGKDRIQSQGTQIIREFIFKVTEIDPWLVWLGGLSAGL